MHQHGKLMERVPTIPTVPTCGCMGVECGKVTPFPSLPTTHHYLH